MHSIRLSFWWWGSYASAQTTNVINFEVIFWKHVDTQIQKLPVGKLYKCMYPASDSMTVPT